MADIKVNCVSIRCDQTPGYGMEVTLGNTDIEKLKEELISKYKNGDIYTVLSTLEYEGLLGDNEKLKQKVKNLRGKLSARDT